VSGGGEVEGVGAQHPREPGRTGSFARHVPGRRGGRKHGPRRETPAVIATATTIVAVTGVAGSIARLRPGPERRSVGRQRLGVGLGGERATGRGDGGPVRGEGGGELGRALEACLEGLLVRWIQVR